MTRPRFSEIELNLFPFLSVLVAVIGILMLFLVSIISTRVIGALTAGGTGGEAESAGPGEDQSPLLEDQQHAALELQIRQLAAQLIERRRECKELQNACRRLDDLVKARGDAGDLGPTGAADLFPGLVLGQPIEVEAVPDPARTDARKPIPVELSAEGCTVHSKGKTFVYDPAANEPSLQQFLKGVDLTKSETYLLLLVHPNGVETCYRLRGYLLEKFGTQVDFEGQRIPRSRIDLGVEPFDRDWLLIERAP